MLYRLLVDFLLVCVCVSVCVSVSVSVSVSLFPYLHSGSKSQLEY
jgi:hypothetical protein